MSQNGSELQFQNQVLQIMRTTTFLPSYLDHHLEHHRRLLFIRFDLCCPVTSPTEKSVYHSTHLLSSFLSLIVLIVQSRPSTKLFNLMLGEILRFASRTERIPALAISSEQSATAESLHVNSSPAETSVVKQGNHDRKALQPRRFPNTFNFATCFYCASCPRRQSTCFVLDPLFTS